MDSIMLRNWNIQEESMEELIGYAGITAKYAANLLSALDLCSSGTAVHHATKFIVEIALVDLERTLDLLAEEAARRESEKEALEEIRTAETPEGKAAQVEEAKRVLPHMMEQLVANLRAECSGKEGAA